MTLDSQAAPGPDPRQWRRVQQVFEDVVELDGGRRAARLGELCGGEPGLRDAVEELLAFDLADDDTLAGGGMLLAGASTDRGGERFGPYRLKELLGAGGMGEVYSAERVDGAYRREVAIKLLPPFASRGATARFLHERQILANLYHPNIAMLLDGGFTDGQPFLVMELVRGEPLVESCRRRRLTVAERLELVAQIADALAYAHRQGIVHRDIKPQNILVSEDGVPKLLDFGIAEMTTGGDSPTADGRPATRRLSPGYCSPEQLRGEAGGVTSDVFSLGVVLFELLTDRRPFAAEGLDALRSRMEAGPPAMSGLETSPEESSRIARDRRASPRRLRRWLKGDLDRVVRRALEPAVDDRYPKVTELARDLRRWGQRRPVSARPASLGYRFWKLAARRPATLVASSLALLAGILLLWSNTARRENAARQQDAAAALEERAARSVDVLLDVVRLVDPAERPGRPLSAEEVLRRGEERARGELARDPVALAEVLAGLADSHREIGNLQRAGELALEALDLRRQQHAAGRIDLVEMAASLDQLGAVRRLQGRFEEAEPLCREALRLQRSFSDGDGAALARTVDNLAETLHELGHFDQAEPLYREALALRRRHLGEDHPLVAESLVHFGLLRLNRGQTDAALSLYRQALELRRRVLPNEHPDLAESLYLVGGVKAQVGRLDEARRDLERAAELYRGLYGDDHPSTLLCRHDLGLIYLDQKDYAAAETTLRQVLAGRSRIYGDPHPELAQSYSALAAVLSRRSDVAGARDLIEKSIRVNRQLFGPGHPYVLRDLVSQAYFETRLDRLGSAESLLREAVAGYRETVEPTHSDLCLAVTSLGHNLHLQGRGEADRLLAEGFGCYRAALGEDHPATLRAADWLAEHRGHSSPAAAARG